ncbi:MAG: hypothetical protein IJS39_10325 [Synergistaceae bacterium]|nr:hypothetical protein [Synergistaceae bacterium]
MMAILRLVMSGLVMSLLLSLIRIASFGQLRVFRVSILSLLLQSRIARFGVLLRSSSLT